MLKLNLHIILLLVINSFFTSSSYAQKQQVGFSLGSGKTVIRDNIHNEPSFFLSQEEWKEKSNYFMLGVNYYITPKHTILRIKTGVDYNFRKYEKSQFSYLSIPLGLDLVIGKKLKLIIGMGVYFSHLIAYQIDSYDKADFDNTRKKNQRGLSFNAGLSYDISDLFILNIMLSSNYDRTLLYSSAYTKGGVSTTIVEHRGYDCVLSVGVVYSIKN